MFALNYKVTSFQPEDNWRRKRHLRLVAETDASLVSIRVETAVLILAVTKLRLILNANLVNSKRPTLRHDDFTTVAKSRI